MESCSTPLVALALDLSDWRESGTGNLEVDRLTLGRFGAGSGVLLRGISGSSMISLLLPEFFDIFVEMLPVALLLVVMIDWLVT